MKFATPGNQRCFSKLRRGHPPNCPTTELGSALFHHDYYSICPCVRGEHHKTVPLICGNLHLFLRLWAFSAWMTS